MSSMTPGQCHLFGVSRALVLDDQVCGAFNLDPPLRVDPLTLAAFHPGDGPSASRRCHRFSDLGQVELITHGRQEVSTGMLDQFVNTRVFAVETPGLRACR
jgi:hypothetical protein